MIVHSCIHAFMLLGLVAWWHDSVISRISGKGKRAKCYISIPTIELFVFHEHNSAVYVLPVEDAESTGKRMFAKALEDDVNAVGRIRYSPVD